jgi:hypothetical protein
MATLALAAVGSVVGGALLPAGLSVFGATISGAAIGTQIGALAGSYVDNALFASTGQSRAVEGPRLSDLRVTASTEGAPIPRLYGRARLGGQVIWATNFEEVTSTQDVGGGKGSPRSGGGTSVTYSYFCSFAVAICEGAINGLGRVWADGREISLDTFTHRLHLGTADQSPDPLIEAKMGAGNAPAFRGTAYIVFERIPLADFGNRLPQLSFEVFRSVDDAEKSIRGVCLIPGSGEFVYSPTVVNRRRNLVRIEPENKNTLAAGSDFTVAVDQLQATLPNATSVSLIVSWFGSDLRAGHCLLRPAVETADKTTSPISWSVAGLTRASAPVVSQINGRANYGGTPSDQTVIAAIQNLKSRGLSVTMTPFILMDIPPGNTLPDPYSAAASQPLFPWRGRITCHPAAGQPGTPDKTATAAAQVAAFVGTAQAAHFAIVNGAVVYSGPAEWSFRRMILHHAFLCVAAGGVSAFVIGSELRGLTTIRSAQSTYPFVAALQTLAADVKAILGATTKVLYAADWSEYFGHQPGDGSNDLHFHLDPLWASSAIDAIGIDVYWPLSDWRDGRSHLDWQAGYRSPYDLSYLKANMFGGEGFDWYYASTAARAAQTRTPITDGAGKPWVYRYKDIKSWWLNAHYNRPGGVESTTPTAWVPQSKPFWLMEIGCPAVDKGANQPNVFVDPKSSETALPYFSSGVRDDHMQRRLIQAMTEAFDPAHQGYVAGANPVSLIYAGRMVDVSRIHVYAWDARPYPAFPNRTDVWGDGANYQLGHWINGRVTSAPLAPLIRRLFADADFTAVDADRLDGTLAGYVLDRIMSVRDALQPLELGFFFDTRESGGKIVLDHRGATDAVATLGPDQLVEVDPKGAPYRITRGQETDLPAQAKLTYIAATGAYPQAVAEARRRTGASARVASAALPLVLDPAQANAIAETWLYETWIARERAGFTLPPSRLALEPSDTVVLSLASASHRLRITSLGDHGARDIEALTIDPDIYNVPPLVARADDTSGAPIAAPVPALALFLDLPPFAGAASPLGHVALSQSPWPGPIAVLKAPGLSGYVLEGIAPSAARVAELLAPVSAGVPWRLDNGTRLRVRCDQGQLTSVSDLDLLGGANLAALETIDGRWELIQFKTATLVAPATYDLTDLLRGQVGTEHLTPLARTPGQRLVMLDGAIASLDLTSDEIGLAFNWRYGPANRDIGDPTYGSAEHTVSALSLQPFAPVRVRATRTNGDLNLNWIRRARHSADSWEVSEIPLAEASESYAIDILDGTTVVRALTSTTPSVVYTAAQQTQDFGAPQSSISLRIAQVSALVGRGQPTALVV